MSRLEKQPEVYNQPLKPMKVDWLNRMPDEHQRIIKYDSAAREPKTGLTGQEIYRRARMWWDHHGRQEVRRARSRPRDGLVPDAELLFRSGTLSGKVFDRCTAREQQVITSAWLETYTRALYEKLGPAITPDNPGPNLTMLAKDFNPDKVWREHEERRRNNPMGS